MKNFGGGMMSPMTAKMPMRASPPVGDDFNPTTTTPNQTAPQMPSRDGPANDMRMAKMAQKPKTTEKAKPMMGKMMGGKAKMPAGKSSAATSTKMPMQNKMPAKTMMDMKKSIKSMGM